MSAKCQKRILRLQLASKIMRPPTEAVFVTFVTRVANGSG